jgi:hypothetical protein
VSSWNGHGRGSCGGRRRTVSERHEVRGWQKQGKRAKPALD